MPARVDLYHRPSPPPPLSWSSTTPPPFLPSPSLYLSIHPLFLLFPSRAIFLPLRYCSLCFYLARVRAARVDRIGSRV